MKCPQLSQTSTDTEPVQHLQPSHPPLRAFEEEAGYRQITASLKIHIAHVDLERD